MSLNQFLDNEEARIAIAHKVVKELQAELQDGWADEALGIKTKKRKVVPPEEFYSEEYPNEYERPENYEY